MARKSFAEKKENSLRHIRSQNMFFGAANDNVLHKFSHVPCWWGSSPDMWTMTDINVSRNGDFVWWPLPSRRRRRHSMQMIPVESWNVAVNTLWLGINRCWRRFSHTNREKKCEAITPTRWWWICRMKMNLSRPQLALRCHSRGSA